MVARHSPEQQQLKRAEGRSTWYSADVVSALNILIFFFQFQAWGIEKAHANALSHVCVFFPFSFMPPGYGVELSNLVRSTIFRFQVLPYSSSRCSY